LAALRPAPDITLTTNGVTLARHARELAESGLHRVNVSLDTLHADRFAALTRRDRLADVLAGIEAAADAGLTPMKINAVLMRGQNFDEAGSLLDWALQHGYQLRFIEHMPLDADRSWSAQEMVRADEIVAELERRFVLAPTTGRGAAPAELFDVLDGPGRDGWPAPRPQVGVIASVTRPFCRDCDRLRLTADGQLRTCLFSRDETDLRGPLRAGATDAELGDLIVQAVAGKQAGHGIGSAAFVQPSRTMSAIGG
jgi:GTP 3',8-cyclase